MPHLSRGSQRRREGTFRTPNEPRQALWCQGVPPLRVQFRSRVGRQAGAGLQIAADFSRPAGLHFVVLLLLWCGALQHTHAQNSPTAESGEFSILSENRPVGVEKFKITPLASGLEATGELQLDMPGSPRLLESCSLKLDAKMRPSSYQRQQRSPRNGAVTAQIGSPETKLTSKTDAGTEDRTFYLPEDHLVVLDTNFFHHYSLLLRQFDPTQPGPQRFNVFVPQEATPGTITLEFKGQDSQVIAKTQRLLNHFLATTEEVKMDIWADAQGEIYRISIPQAKLEILRQ